VLTRGGRKRDELPCNLSEGGAGLEGGMYNSGTKKSDKKLLLSIEDRPGKEHPWTPTDSERRG